MRPVVLGGGRIARIIGRVGVGGRARRWKGRRGGEGGRHDSGRGRGRGWDEDFGGDGRRRGFDGRDGNGGFGVDSALPCPVALLMAGGLAENPLVIAILGQSVVAIGAVII